MEERRNKPKHLIALSTSTGEELWNYDISDWGYLNTSYAVGTDYRFYFAFSTEKETILHAFSESGKLMEAKYSLWRVHPPIVDSDNHVYIGVVLAENSRDTSIHFILMEKLNGNLNSLMLMLHLIIRLY